MGQYIPKSALVAEIEKLEELYCYGESNCMLIAKSVFGSIKNIINTLEVKDVDLDKEIMKYQREIYDRDTTVRDIAKHFFELGLKKV